MLSRLLCKFPWVRKEEWQKVQEDAENTHKHPSWNAPGNSLMFQAFEWHVPADQAHWRRLRRMLPMFKAMGIDNIWIPPACKATSPSSNGYDIYDLYDLGEFDQKGSRSTKWGSRKDLQSFVSLAQDFGIGIYWDAVLNHKAGADSVERFPAVKVNPLDRNKEISMPEVIGGWVGFNFDGRGEQYSTAKYHWHNFSGVDWDDSRQEKAIFKISNHNNGWATDVSDENGNYDYLMFANLDYSNHEVRDDVLNWGHWITSQLPLSGMRLDAVKHYSAGFQKQFIGEIRGRVGKDFFFVGEYWKGEVDALLGYLKAMDYELSLFDVPLLDRFSTISNTKGADMRRVFEGTLVQKCPEHAVTFVANHDTQPGQSLETPIAAFFKPLAYALILLRDQGQPCVFYGDIYGIAGNNEALQEPAWAEKLITLMQARKLYANGVQRDYFDKPNCIGFVRYGNARHPDGLACIISNSKASRKRMFVGHTHARERWTDILKGRSETVKIDRRGYGVFPVAEYSVSVWVKYTAARRENLHHIFDGNIYDY
ncbi:glycoside hydrolase superfamily [Aspergillus unguis]